MFKATIDYCPAMKDRLAEVAALPAHQKPAPKKKSASSSGSSPRKKSPSVSRRHKGR